MTDPKLDRLYDRIQRATAHADDPRDTQLWRDVAARLRDDEAAVADANQRAEQAEAERDAASENIGHAENDVDILQAELDALRAIVRNLTTADDVAVEWDPAQYGWTPAEADIIRRALVADQPATGEDDERPPKCPECGDHAVWMNGEWVLCPEHLREHMDAIGIPAWPDETRRQPDQEHT